MGTSTTMAGARPAILLLLLSVCLASPVDNHEKEKDKFFDLFATPTTPVPRTTTPPGFIESLVGVLFGSTPPPPLATTQAGLIDGILGGIFGAQSTTTLGPVEAVMEKIVNMKKSCLFNFWWIIMIAFYS